MLNFDLVKESKHISTAAAEKIIARRRLSVDSSELIRQILDGNTTALSRGITLIESRAANHNAIAQELIEGCLPHANTSLRIGITGVPGVGKSTFIETFGNLLIQKGKKVAVLAVDPSSGLSNGSILGDKTRMQTLSVHPKAFIRPSASGDSLGGVARKTREAIILCEAAGFDIIIVETVGVGQSEVAVHSMTDFFLLLKLAGAGDELQGIKRGIIEMADAILINKADGEMEKAAAMAKNAFAKALHLYPLKASEWQPKVSTCSALHSKGVEDAWKIIENYLKTTQNNGFFEKNRRNQNSYWLRQSIENALKDDFYGKKEVKNSFSDYLKAINSGKMTPFQAAAELLKLR
ncbi:methylmalonyl Co-A mutase-associated GTPase MeaB [Flavimarina sp. Hel_I_48]|uniref:methylmalonyl Co-A mutase-associated GTPase MeaB n=1 Tax=Flavimarina sp. Hel_I_48 TaxID=1392488 RepID=UPI001F12CD5E|nr:methylmalonyl Co-A mutase-associated GTPase MeaB [Flavimarina sp. Hel_I_48]